MKATVLLLVCLAVTGIVNARHRQDSRKESTREHRRENRLSGRDTQHKWEYSSEDNRLDETNEKWQHKRKDNRQDDSLNSRENKRVSNGQKNRKKSSRNNWQESREDNRQTSGEDQIQQIRLQWNSESNRPKGRDILIENRGKIVNNGLERNTQPTQKQLLLNQLGYTQNIEINRSGSTNNDMLLKQKFLLDIVLNVKHPLKNERLEALGEMLILDEQQYTGQFDDDMSLLVQLCVDGQMLSKQDNFNALNRQQLRQLLGLYKLLLRARDWDTFQRNACFARLHLNGELFINALLLAVRDRHDTQELILPTINEILPELYYDNGLLQRARDVDVGNLLELKTGNKPQLGNMWERENVISDDMRSSLRASTRWGARWGAPQTKKTWQEWRQEKLDKQAGRVNVPMAGPTVQQNIIVPVPFVENKRTNDLEQRIAYLTQDIGLNNFWYNFGIDSLSKIKLTTRGNRVDAPKIIAKIHVMDPQTKLDTQTSKGLLYSNRRRWNQVQEDVVQNSGNEIEKNLRISKDSRQNSAESGFLDSKLIDEQILELKQQLQREDKIQTTRETLNLEVQKLPGINNDRLLKTNRRRLNQKIQSNNNSNENRVENNKQQLEYRRRVSNLANLNEEDNIQKSVERTNTDEARLLRINRPNNQHSTDKFSSEDSNEITRRSSRESVENNGLSGSNLQAQEFGKIIDSNADNQIVKARLLKVSRRRLNQNQVRNSQDSDENIASVSDENLREDRRTQQDATQAINRQTSSERNSQNSNPNIGILAGKHNDDERLLKVNQRRIQQKIALRQQNADMQDANWEHSKDAKEEIQRAASTGVEQDLGKLEGINAMDNRNSYVEIGVSDRNRKDNKRKQQVQRQKEDLEDLRGPMVHEEQPDLRRFGMLRSTRLEDPRLLKVNRRRNSRISKESSSQEDSNELQQGNRDAQTPLEKLERRQNSKESSSQEHSNELMENKAQKQSSEESSEEREQLKISRRRLPRSIGQQLKPKLVKLAESRAGELTLTTMQQIQARLQMERLSHQLEIVLGKQKKNIANNLESRILESPESRPLLLLMQSLSRILRTIVEDELQLLSPDGYINLQHLNVLEVIGEVITNRLSNSGLDVFQVWSKLEQQLHDVQLQQTKTGSLVSLSNMAQQLREPILSYLMQSILSIANTYTEQLPSYNVEDLLLNGVRLNDIKVDKLQTYFDESDADLINALDQPQVPDLSKLQRMIVARQQRLNHKSFSIKFEVNATRAGRVIIRTFLGPKLDANGNVMQLNENRRNFMLLDAFTTALTPGGNSIKRKSTEISWTSRDATALTEIYKQVVLGLEHSEDVQLNGMSGNNCRFPQRLLLPRGLPQGLPMQLFVIITPLTEQDALLQQQQSQQMDGSICGMGIAAIALDTLPLGFPLDRRIDNVQNMLVPNVMLKDVTIYHDKKEDGN